MGDRSPKSWGKLHSPDPFLTLSNLHIEHNYSSGKKQHFQDRFLNDIKCKLNFDSDPDSAISNQNTEITERSKKKSFKQKSYKSVLLESLKKTFQPSYKSKIIRGGFLDFYNNLGEKQVQPVHTTRQFPKTSYKVLNAPRLKDDFYTCLLDWSKDDLISVVLDNGVYIWPSKGNDAQKLVQGYISSVKWGRGLVVGEETGRIRVIDAEKRKQTARSKNHLGRVGVLDVSISGNQIVSGSKDSQMILWDVRQRQSCIRFSGHKQQICGLKWSWDNGLLATGGNDNLVIVWDPRMGRHLGKLNEHTAAVKALAWSPHKSSLLVSGGGSTDKSIKTWSTIDMNCQSSRDTGSQVCNMLFSTSTNELVTTHGYSLNSINVWDARNMNKMATLQGHTYRVLYLAKSPDEQSILTGSGDQTLRFWKLFPSSKNDVESNSCLEARNSTVR